MSLIKILFNKDTNISKSWQIDSQLDIEAPNVYDIELSPNKRYKIDAEGVVTSLTSQEYNDYMETRLPYDLKRKTHYPTIGDQLDRIFKTFKHLDDIGIDLGLEGNMWIDEIEAVKQEFPKT